MYRSFIYFLRPSNRYQYIHSEHYEHLLNYLLPEFSDIGADHPDEQHDAETEFHERSG